MDAEARALYDAGVVAYEQGRYENALDYFSRAHELSTRPQLLFNIASAADRLRQDQRALDAYRAYLEALPDAENRAAVESRVRILEEQLAAAETQPAEPIEAPVEEASVEAQQTAAPMGVTAAPPEPERSVARIAILSGAAVVLAAGAALAVVGARDYSRVEGISDGDRWSDFEDSHARAQPMLIAGTVLSVVGIAGIVVGAILPKTTEGIVAFTGNGAAVRW